MSLLSPFCFCFVAVVEERYPESGECAQHRCVESFSDKVRCVGEAPNIKKLWVHNTDNAQSCVIYMYTGSVS